MKPGQTVSLRQLNSAVYDVQEELYGVGLWYEGAPLTETEIYWCRWPQLDVPTASGFFIDDLWGISGAIWCLLGYQAGHIYIPSWVLAHGPFQNRGSIRSVIRHEMGHALMYRRPKIGNSKAFRNAFGASYDADIKGTMPRDCYVSSYAMTNPAEDFAETFMCWLRNPSKKWAGPKKLRAKFRYVKRLCERCGG